MQTVQFLLGFRHYFNCKLVPKYTKGIVILGFLVEHKKFLKLVLSRQSDINPLASNEHSVIFWFIFLQHYSV